MRHTYDIKMNRCPFCKHEKIGVYSKQTRFIGKNDFGAVKVRLCVYCMCCKCHAKGPAVFTDFIYFVDGYKDKLEELKCQSADLWNEVCE
jgi:hypothetical protein